LPLLPKAASNLYISGEFHHQATVMRDAGGDFMGCCVGKKYLKILAGLALLGISLKYLSFDPWMVVGAFFLLAGVAPFVCQCEACTGGCCMDTKKKK
jgi:hypothetical protein